MRSSNLAILLLPALIAAEPRQGLLLFTAAEAETLKLKAKAQPKRLRAWAEEEMKKGPWSVTFHRPTPSVTKSPNDFFSEGPYWWPDPKNPAAKYVRRDGEVNPDRFTANDRDLSAMSHAVLVLGMAAYLFDEPRYAERAAEVLDVWFVRPATRMNPHLEYGQAIRGHNTGRPAGIIDSRPLISAAQGIAFLHASGRWPQSRQTPVRQWFGEYLRWLNSSKIGVGEKNSGNNHATWWTAQVAAYAVTAGDGAALRMTADWYRRTLVPGQIQPDGSCPRELARTKSLSYSSFNLEAFATFLKIAETHGEKDLWKWHAPSGAGVVKAIEYVMPYLRQPQSWKGQQLGKFEPNRQAFPVLAGRGLGRQEWVDFYRSLPEHHEPIHWALRRLLD